MLDAVAKRAEEYVVEINVSEAEHTFDRRTERYQFFNHKAKRNLLLISRIVQGPLVIGPIGQIGPIVSSPKTFA